MDYGSDIVKLEWLAEVTSAASRADAERLLVA